MQPILRVPIHTNTPHGKLRKSRREYPSASSQVTALAIQNTRFEHQAMPPSVAKKQTRCKFFVRTKRPTLSPQKVPEGSFRAIHTAHESDAIKGFPLRSVTPIRPFRRGVRASQLTSFLTVDLENLKSRRTSYNAVRPVPHRGDTPFHEVMTIQKPTGVGGEQFFKIKAPHSTDRNPLEQPSQKGLAGKKIEPFFKYQTISIRQNEGQSPAQL